MSNARIQEVFVSLLKVRVLLPSHSFKLTSREIMGPPTQPSKPKLTPITVPPPSSSPSGPSSPQLLTPHTPLTLQSHDERSPLLRRVASIGPDTLRRKSHQISDLLFAHSEPLERDDRTRSLSRARSGYFSVQEEEGGERKEGRERGYDGEFRMELEGEGANGVRGWYGKSLLFFIPVMS